ncbi:uncharacterized protein [Montipora foliosa]|uniref:uncharacterized protein n=1 Tax=Montipora foliosa TaxID=591990 RepID=UPI0035F12927
MVKCRILGCNVVYRLGRQYMHDQECYQRHQEFLECDVEKLRCAIFEKADESVRIRRNIFKRNCFRWTLKPTDYAQRHTENIKSPLFGFDRKMFTCVWAQNCSKFILKVEVSSAPVTLRARFAVVQEGQVLQIFSSRGATTLREGQVAGTAVDLAPFKEDQDLDIKIIVITFTHS